MDNSTVLFFATLLIALVLAIHIAWGPRQVWVKISAMVFAALFIPAIGYAALIELKGLPKPTYLEWWQSNAEEAAVLGSLMREGQGIYLWLKLADIDEPRSYVLPWSQELAQELQDALRQAEENGTAVQMRLPFEPSFDNREPKFYAMPQPAFPPKESSPSDQEPLVPEFSL